MPIYFPRHIGLLSVQVLVNKRYRFSPSLTVDGTWKYM
jgi:hypothetical protein